MQNWIKQCAIIFGLWTCLAWPARAEFTVTPTTVTMAEGGTAEVLLVVTDDERFSFNIPRGYRSQAAAETRSVVLSSDDGISAITVSFSTNYARALPKQEALRNQVSANHPTGTVIVAPTAGTGLGPGQTFDIFQPAGKGLLLRIRDIYAAYPEGSVEIAFSCDSANFDKQKVGFMQMVNSFRLLDKNATINP